MNQRNRVIARATGLLLIAIGAGLLVASCARKPAYSDIQTDQEKSQAQREAQRKASEQSEQSEQATASPSTDAPTPQAEQGAAPAPPQGAAGNPREMAPPSFLDQKTGEFKDLPRYPNAIRTNAQVGPIGGIETAMFLLETSDPLERITSFYTKAIRQNGWDVVSSVQDAEYLKWDLMKDKTSEARIEVKKDPKSERKSILLSRAERPEGK